MDLGIAGKTAIVCGSSRGLGRACAHSLAKAGCKVVVNGVRSHLQPLDVDPKSKDADMLTEALRFYLPDLCLVAAWDI